MSNFEIFFGSFLLDCMHSSRLPQVAMHSMAVQTLETYSVDLFNPE